MAAIVQPHRIPVTHSPSRPDLRLIQGGRGAAGAPPAAFPLRIALLSFLTVFTVLFLSIAIGRGAFGALSPAPAATPATVSAGAGAGSGQVIRVRAGDTIWSIARRLRPTGDVRPLVDQHVRAHGSATLQAGDRLVLPY